MIFNRKFTEKAFAKINLYLDVTSKRSDGFHESIMQSVSLFDDITVSLSESCEDIITCNIEGIPTDERNLAIKAADAFRSAVGLTFGVNIHIEKRIPASAGLAGGSTDAAAVLRLLKKLTESDIPTDEMLKIAASIGADVPFCYIGGTMLCEGKGELLRGIPACPKMHLVVAIKGEGVSTPWAYGELDARYGDFAEERDKGSFHALYCALEDNDKKRIIKNLYNIFESVTEPERPEIGKLKEIMTAHGAKSTLMSGSGPSVFGIFEDEEPAHTAEKSLIEYGAKAHYCTI